MKQSILIAVILCLGLPVIPQRTLDLVTVGGRYGFPGSYQAPYSGEAKELGSIIDIKAGIPLTDKTTIPINVNHFYFNIQGGTDIPAGEVGPVVLNGLIVRTGLLQKFSRGRSIQILVAPRLMSDFKQGMENSFQIGGLVTYEKIFREELIMSFGAFFNQELFGPYLVPVVGLEWQLSNRWSITGMLPIYAKVNYRVNDNLTAGISHFGLSTTYYLGDEAYQGDYIERFSIDPCLFARQRLFGNLYAEGRIGRSLSRKYKQYSGDDKVSFAIPLVAFGDNRTIKNVKFDDGIIAELRLVFNIIRPE